MSDIDTGSIQTLIESADTYGFLLVFGVIMLLIIIIIVNVLMKRWNSMLETKAKNDSQKSQIELSLMEKQQLAQLDQQDKMFTLVTEVQTNQIGELRQISEITRLVKDELQNNTKYIIKQNNNIEKLNTSMSTVIEKYQTVSNAVLRLGDEIIDTDKKIDEIIITVDELKHSLNELTNEIRGKN